MIGQLNRRVTLKAWGSTQDEAGGVIASVVAFYPIWAKVEDRNGRLYQGEQQREWSYDYKVTFRYEKSRVVSSGMTIDYDGKRLTINSISFLDEGQRKYAVARCSALDNINTSGDGEIVEPDGLSSILIEVEAGTDEAIEAGIIVGASSYTNSRMIGRKIEVNRGGWPIANIPQTGNPDYVTKELNSDTVYFHDTPIYFGEYIKITLA